MTEPTNIPEFSPASVDPRTESWFSEWLNRRGLVDYRTLPFPSRARYKIKEQTFTMIFTDVNP